MPQPPSRQITLIVTASGQDVPVRVNIQQKTDQLVREALRLSGNAGQPPEGWELRRADGTLVPMGVTVAAAGLVDGMQLSLAPRTAEGG